MTRNCSQSEKCRKEFKKKRSWGIFPPYYAIAGLDSLNPTASGRNAPVVILTCLRPMFCIPPDGRFCASESACFLRLVWMCSFNLGLSLPFFVC